MMLQSLNRAGVRKTDTGASAILWRQLTQRIAKRFRREHRAKTSAANLATPDQFLFKNGNPMAILRPPSERVEEKLRLFDEIPSGLPYEAHQAYISEILCDKIPHQFIGYALRDSRIVDCSGKSISKVQPGDSFVSPGEDFLQLPDFMVTGRMHAEVWDGRKVLVLPRPDLKADSNTGIVLESPDEKEKASIVLRGGAAEVDCHIPTLNQIWTGDRNRDYRSVEKPAALPQPETGASLDSQNPKEPQS